MTEFNLNFMHPQYGTTMNVDIDGSFTVEEMINNLLLSGFINENHAGYDLALMGETLDRQASFEEINSLYDGAVIRIIAHTQQQAVASRSILLHLKHPSDQLILDYQLPVDAPLNQAIQAATDKNFIAGDKSIFHLQKGDKLLDLNEIAADNALSHGDYLQLVEANKKEEIDPVQTAVEGMEKKFSTLESQIQTELQAFKEALPAANMIPVDPTRVVNPTMEVYESIDTIVGRLRQSSGEPSLKPVKPFPTQLVVGLLFFLLVIVLLVVVAFGVV